MALRIETALPVGIAFFFGCATGIVVGHLVTKGSAPAAQAQAAPQGMGMGGQQQAEQSGEPTQADLLQMLDVHQKLLEKSPDNVSLMTTVGNYQAALGRAGEAAATYDKAEKLGRETGASPKDMAQVFVGQAMVLADREDLPGAIAKCQAAADLDPSDTHSRSLEVYLTMTRFMPAAPAGTDRKALIAKMKTRIDEVLALDPGNSEMLQFKSMIESVERMRSEQGAGSAAPPAP